MLAAPVNNGEGPMPREESEQMIWSVRVKIRQLCRSKMSMLVSETQLRGPLESFNKIVDVQFESKARVEAVLDTLRISGDLVPLAEFTNDTSTPAGLPTVDYEPSKKELRLDERLKAKRGVTPMSEVKSFLVDSVSSLVGRQHSDIFVSLHSLPEIADEAVRALRRECLEQLDTRKGLMMKEVLQSFYNTKVSDSFTRGRLHVYLISHGLVKTMSVPGKPDVIRVVQHGESLPIQDDIEHLWLQAERIYIESEMKKRKMAQEQEPWFNPLNYIKLRPWSQARTEYPAYISGMSHVTDTEMRERLKEIEENIIRLDSKHFQEHPEDWEKHIVLAIHGGKNRITPDINLIHQIFSTASPVAPQLWNIYQYLNRVAQHAIIKMHQNAIPTDGVEIHSVDDLVKEIFRDTKDFSKSINGLCSIAFLHPESAIPVFSHDVDQFNANYKSLDQDIVNWINLYHLPPGQANPGLPNPDQHNPDQIIQHHADPHEVNYDQIDPALANFTPENSHLVNPGLASISLAVHILANHSQYTRGEIDSLLDPSPTLSNNRKKVNPNLLAQFLHENVNLSTRYPCMFAVDLLGPLIEEEYCSDKSDHNRLSKYVRAVYSLAKPDSAVHDPPNHACQDLEDPQVGTEGPDIADPDGDLNLADELGWGDVSNLKTMGYKLLWIAMNCVAAVEERDIDAFVIALNEGGNDNDDDHVAAEDDDAVDEDDADEDGQVVFIEDDVSNSDEYSDSNDDDANNADEDIDDDEDTDDDGNYNDDFSEDEVENGNDDNDDDMADIVEV